MTKPDDQIFVVGHRHTTPHAADAGVFADAVASALGPNARRLSLEDGAPAGFASANPTGMVYVPPPGALTDNLQVFKRLRRMFGAAPRVMVHLSPLREHDRPRWPVRIRCADPILVLSYRSLLAVARLSLKGDVIPVGVDLSRFPPADAAAKKLARSRLDIDTGAFVFLWDVDDDGADVLEEFRARYPAVVVVAFHAAGPVPVPVRERLDLQGIKCVDAPARLVELLWAADAFVFSSAGGQAGVETPFIVPAALAAGLPVLTRPVGGLPDFFEENGDLRYWNTVDELDAAARRMVESGGVHPRDMAAFSWEGVARRVADVLARGTDSELAVPGRRCRPTG